MAAGLLERTEELGTLGAALASAASGHGSVVLVAGEAGIGKSTLIRSFTAGLGAGTRVLAGACDDLITPRTLGAIREAFAGRSPRLEELLAAGARDDLLAGVLAELTDPARPTVLVVEDVHWADDATLDVLRYVCRRVEDTAAVVVVSYRDDEVGRDHPARRLLGGLTGVPVHRLPVPRLSPAAVAALAGGTRLASAELYRLTGGNPFYVTEVVADGDGAVPVTVADAVLARVHRLPPATRNVLERLAVIPSQVELPLARTLLGDLAALAEAERRGVLQVRPDAVAFRHELARRAVEDAVPLSERMRTHAEVLAILTAREDIDLPRALHHAVEAADDAAVVELAPRAAAQAARAGSYTQEIGCLRLLLEREHLVAPADAAAVRQQLSSSLWVVDELAESLEHGLAAVRMRERLGDVAAVGEALLVLPPTQMGLGRTQDTLAGVARAIELLGAVPETPARTLAHVHHSLTLGIIGDARMLDAAREAAASAERTGVPEFVALSTMCLGRARLLLGEPDAGLELMRAGLAGTRAANAHLFTMLCYGFTVVDLFDLGRYEECRRCVDEAMVYGNECEMWFLVEHLQVYRHRLQALHGEWDAAIDGLREIVGPRGDPERASARYALGALAALLARRESDDAGAVRTRALDYARRADCYHDWMTALPAEIEAAWLADDPAAAQDAVDRLDELTARAGRETERGELYRWKRRLGLSADVPPGCPERWAAGIRGDWRAAAAAWGAEDAPYPRALELLDSGEAEPTLEALQVLDDLGAKPAVQIARRRLRDLGVTQIPHGPRRTTRENPAGLTARQIDVLRLLAGGLTNAEIAARLVITEKTTDHHVSAILTKLGVPHRRAAAAAARDLGIAPDRRRVP
ncbi:AAA family ATPase [Actinomycetospora sp. C-140]